MIFSSLTPFQREVYGKILKFQRLEKMDAKSNHFFWNGIFQKVLM